MKGELGNPSHLRDENKSGSESKFCVIFEWDHEVLGAPGAFIIKNLNTSEFYLKSLTLEASDPSQDTVQFVCNSWVYPAEKYKSDRIFFVNQVQAK